MHPKSIRRRAIALYRVGLSCRASAGRVSLELGTAVTPQTVARWAREDRINRPVGDRRTAELPKEAFSLYESGMTINDLADRFQLSQSTVRERLREGLTIRPRGLKYPRLADKQWLENQYWKKGRSAKEIANQVGCSVLTVHYHLRKHDIPRKRKRKLRARTT